MMKLIKEIILIITAWHALKVIFDNDESKIVTELGWYYLSDPERLEEIKKQNGL